MRVCQLCAGPMPKIVRDDALYCSTSCKLKAQRKRKKERARQANDEGPHFFEPIAPFGNVEQLSFRFKEGPSEIPIPKAEPAKSETARESSAPEAEKVEPRSWFDKFIDRILS